MALARLRRRHAPNQMGASLEDLPMLRHCCFAFASDLARPKRPLQRLIQQTRQIRSISIQGFDQTEDGRIKALDELGQRLFFYVFLFVAAAIPFLAFVFVLVIIVGARISQFGGHRGFFRL